MNIEKENTNIIQNIVTFDNIPSHEDKVWCLSLHPKLNVFASCSSDKSIKIFEYKTDMDKDTKKLKLEVNIIQTIEGFHTRTIRSISWDNSGYMIAAASFDGTSSILSFPKVDDKPNFDSYNIIATLKGHENEVKSIDWSCNNNYIATCSRDKTIWIWELEEDSKEIDCMYIGEGHTQDIKSIKFHPTKNDMVFSSSYDNSIRIWKLCNDEEDWTCINVISSFENTIWSMSISLEIDKEYIYCCTEDSSIYKIDITNPKETAISASNKQCHSEYSIYSISSSDKIVATGGGDNLIGIYTTDLKEITKLSIHDDDINCVVIKKLENEDKYLLFSSSDDNTIKITQFDYNKY